MIITASGQGMLVSRPWKRYANICSFHGKYMNWSTVIRDLLPPPLQRNEATIRLAGVYKGVQVGHLHDKTDDMQFDGAAVLANQDHRNWEAVFTVHSKNVQVSSNIVRLLNKTMFLSQIQSPNYDC